MRAQIQSIPKVELHCHLDGSVSMSYLKRQSKRQGIDIDLSRVYVKDTCENLDDYLKCFDEILKVMQTAESLSSAVHDVAQQAEADGVRYIELRFAPLLHTKQGLTVEDVFGAVCEGVAHAEATYDITVRIIVCGMKHHTNEANIALFELMASHRAVSDYIVGVDLAGSEEAFPTHTQQAVIEYAQQLEHVTLHAGECGCNKNVYDAIALGAKRIGHGVSSFEDAALLQQLKEKDVLLEICPKSNLQTRAIKDIAQLDIQRLLALGVPFVINTDNRTVTQTTLVSEYALLVAHEALAVTDIYHINARALNYSFLTEQKKADIAARYFNRTEVTVDKKQRAIGSLFE